MSSLPLQSYHNNHILFYNTGMGYTDKVIKGFSWDTGKRVATYILTIVKIYILARILDPTDFGHFSLVAIAWGFSEAVTETGINLTIIQSKHSVDYFLDTAWVIAIIRGFLIGIVMIGLGWGMSWYFTNPILLSLTTMAALIPVIKGFINPYIVVLHKKMHYAQDTLFRFSIVFVEILLAILLGIWLRSAYALVLAMVGSAILEVSLSFIFFQKKPQLHYLPSRAKVIFDNARWLSVGSLLNYLVENIDDFLVGSITNSHDLGIYHNSYSMTHKTNYEIAKAVHYGTIPVYTKINHESQRLKKAFFKSVAATIVIISAFSFPFLLFPDWIISFFLGEKWLAAIPLVPWLTAAGLIQSLSMITYTLLLASKSYKLMNLHLLLTLTMMVILMLSLGNELGLVGAVKGLAYARLSTTPILAYGVYHFFREKHKQ